MPEGAVALNHVCRTSPEHERLDDDDEQVVLRTVHAGWCLSRCLYAVRTAPAAAAVSGTRHTMEEATRTLDDARYTQRLETASFSDIEVVELVDGFGMSNGQVWSSSSFSFFCILLSLFRILFVCYDGADRGCTHQEYCLEKTRQRTATRAFKDTSSKDNGKSRITSRQV